MRGIVLLFLVMVVSIIGWTYCSEESKKGAITLIRRNLLAFIVAALSAAIAVVVSNNSVLRLI